MGCQGPGSDVGDALGCETELPDFESGPFLVLVGGVVLGKAAVDVGKGEGRRTTGVEALPNVCDEKIPKENTTALDHFLG